MPADPVGRGARRSRIARLGPALAVFAGLVALLLIAGLSAPVACACTPLPSVPPSPIEGVVVAVDSAGIGQVKTFTLRLTDGTTIALTLGNLENASQFSPSHLNEHQATSRPILAFYRLEDGKPVVYRLEDAPQPLAT
jgi:hypothetical protein